MIHIERKQIEGARVLSAAEMNRIHFSSGRHSVAPVGSDSSGMKTCGEGKPTPDLGGITIHLKS